MTRQKMFLRMITASLVRRRSRMLVALLAIAVGATILSGLVTIYYDVPRQMGAQFRNYGANMVFVASGNDVVFDMDTVEQGAARIAPEELMGVAPYRYESVMIHEQPIMAAGTDLAGAKTTSPYWYVDGEWPGQSGEVLLGEELSDKLGLNVGDTFNVTYKGGDSEETESEEYEVNYGVDMTVAGILNTGG